MEVGRHVLVGHREIVGWLQKAQAVAENGEQREVIRLLIEFYETGDLKLFDRYSIAWLRILIREWIL